ncbi:hypothetical protein, partial [Paenibacillus lactis]|uniref:hypothetical protein n=1 Tax=Paenibacillus lactis TaxID=228574 RepID=UPI00364AFF6E
PPHTPPTNPKIFYKILFFCSNKLPIIVVEGPQSCSFTIKKTAVLGHHPYAPPLLIMLHSIHPYRPVNAHFFGNRDTASCL